MITTNINVSDYQAFFFDFDGVLVDSVEVKTKAFAKLFEHYGPAVVEKVIDHHRSHGGMNRREKFIHYFESFLGKPCDDETLRSLSDRFSALVVDEIVVAPEIPGAESFLKRMHLRHPCFVVSATPDGEIKEIVTRRGWLKYFRDVGGAPRSKKEILKSLLEKYHLTAARCLYFGDAESDYEAARHCGVDFVGVVTTEESHLRKSVPDLEYIRNFSSLDSE